MSVTGNRGFTPAPFSTGASIESDSNFVFGESLDLPSFGRLALYNQRGSPQSVIVKYLNGGKQPSGKAASVLNTINENFPFEIARGFAYHRDVVGQRRQPSSRLFSDNGAAQANQYFEYLPVTIQNIMNYARETGRRFSDSDLFAVLGFFLGMGLNLEECLGAHPFISPSTLMLNNMKLHLLNPFINDDFTNVMAERIARPISESNTPWNDNMFKVKAAREAQQQNSPEIRAVLQNHASLLMPTIDRCFATLLAMASLQDCETFFKGGGEVNIDAVIQALSAASKHHDNALLGMIHHVLVDQQYNSFTKLSNSVGLQKIARQISQEQSINIMTSTSVHSNPNSIIEAGYLQNMRQEGTIQRLSNLVPTPRTSLAGGPINNNGGGSVEQYKGGSMNFMGNNGMHLNEPGRGGSTTSNGQAQFSNNRLSQQVTDYGNRQESSITRNYANGTPIADRLAMSEGKTRVLGQGESPPRHANENVGQAAAGPVGQLMTGNQLAVQGGTQMKTSNVDQSMNRSIHNTSMPIFDKAGVRNTTLTGQYTGQDNNYQQLPDLPHLVGEPLPRPQSTTNQGGNFMGAIGAAIAQASGTTLQNQGQTSNNRSAQVPTLTAEELAVVEKVFAGVHSNLKVTPLPQGNLNVDYQQPQRLSNANQLTGGSSNYVEYFNMTGQGTNNGLTGTTTLIGTEQQPNSQFQTSTATRGQLQLNKNNQQSSSQFVNRNTSQSNNQGQQQGQAQTGQSALTFGQNEQTNYSGAQVGNTQYVQTGQYGSQEGSQKSQSNVSGMQIGGQNMQQPVTQQPPVVVSSPNADFPLPMLQPQGYNQSQSFNQQKSFENRPPLDLQFTGASQQQVSYNTIPPQTQELTSNNVNQTTTNAFLNAQQQYQQSSNQYSQQSGQQGGQQGIQAWKDLASPAGSAVTVSPSNSNIPLLSNQPQIIIKEVQVPVPVYVQTPVPTANPEDVIQIQLLKEQLSYLQSNIEQTNRQLLQSQTEKQTLVQALNEERSKPAIIIERQVTTPVQVQSQMPPPPIVQGNQWDTFIQTSTSQQGTTQQGMTQQGTAQQGTAQQGTAQLPLVFQHQQTQIPLVSQQGTAQQGATQQGTAQLPLVFQHQQTQIPLVSQQVGGWDALGSMLSNAGQNNNYNVAQAATGIAGVAGGIIQGGNTFSSGGNATTEQNYSGQTGGFAYNSNQASNNQTTNNTGSVNSEEKRVDTSVSVDKQGRVSFGGAVEENYNAQANNQQSNFNQQRNNTNRHLEDGREQQATGGYVQVAHSTVIRPDEGEYRRAIVHKQGHQYAGSNRHIVSRRNSFVGEESIVEGEPYVYDEVGHKVFVRGVTPHARLSRVASASPPRFMRHSTIHAPHIVLPPVLGRLVAPAVVHEAVLPFRRTLEYEPVPIVHNHRVSVSSVHRSASRRQLSPVPIVNVPGIHRHNDDLDDFVLPSPRVSVGYTGARGIARVPLVQAFDDDELVLNDRRVTYHSRSKRSAANQFLQNGSRIQKGLSTTSAASGIRYNGNRVIPTTSSLSTGTYNMANIDNRTSVLNNTGFIEPGARNQVNTNYNYNSVPPPPIVSSSGYSTPSNSGFNAYSGPGVSALRDTSMIASGVRDAAQQANQAGNYASNPVYAMTEPLTFGSNLSAASNASPTFFRQNNRSQMSNPSQEVPPIALSNLYETNNNIPPQSVQLPPQFRNLVGSLGAGVQGLTGNQSGISSSRRYDGQNGSGLLPPTATTNRG